MTVITSFWPIMGALWPPPVHVVHCRSFQKKQNINRLSFFQNIEHEEIFEFRQNSYGNVDHSVTHTHGAVFPIN